MDGLGLPELSRDRENGTVGTAVDDDHSRSIRGNHLYPDVLILSDDEKVRHPILR